MYRFSRAIYRELADEILEDSPSRPHRNHERVLRACEAAVERLATDRHYFARPARTLFTDIRVYFPMSAQERVLRVVERYMAFADEFLRSQPQTGFDIYGNPLRCRAMHAQGHPVPADAAATQRLLPVTPAPCRDRGLPRVRGRAGGRLSASIGASAQLIARCIYRDIW